MLGMVMGAGYLYVPEVIAQEGAAAPAQGSSPFVSMGDMINALEEKAEDAGAGKKQKGAARAQREAKIAVSILFKYDSTEVMPASQAQVDEMGKALTDPKLKGWKFEIGGHTDTSGKDDYNLQLSQRRADAIKDYLVSKYGIEADRLVSKGYGETKPVVTPDDTDAKRLMNRRVEILRQDRYTPGKQ